MTRRELLGPVKLGKERLAFLAEAAAVRPELLVSLRDLLPGWSKARTHTGGEADLLLPWMRRFNLESQWMWRALRNTLTYWSLVPPSAPLAWPPAVKNVAYRMPVPEPPSFGLPRWEPDFEPAEKYVERVAIMAKQEARGYVRKARETLAQSRDWQWVTPKRGAGPKRQPQPLRWLAQYQVAGTSYDDIADGSVESSTVRRAVAAAAKRIGLDLRRTKKALAADRL